MKVTLSASLPIHEEREKARDLPPRGIKREDIFEISIYYAPEYWYTSDNHSKIPRKYSFEIMGRRNKKWTGEMVNGDKRYVDKFSPERILPRVDLPIELIRRNKGTSLLRALRDAIIRHVKANNGPLDVDCARITRKMVDIDEWHKDEE